MTLINLPSFPPEIIINSPFNNETFGRNAPDFNISINGPYDTIWYTIDEGTTNITTSEFIGTIDQNEWDKKGNEIVTIKFYINNTEEYISSAEVQVIKHVINQKTPTIAGYNLIALVGVCSIITLLIVIKKIN